MNAWIFEGKSLSGSLNRIVMLKQLFALFFFFWLAAYSSAEAGLIGYWKFNEAAGTAISDFSGNGNNGTIYGAVWTEGDLGTVLNYDGTDDYVNIPSSPSLNTQSFTVEMWLNPTYKVSDSDGFFYSAPATLRFALYNVNHRAWVRWRKTDGSYVYYNLTATAVPENEWSHLAFTYDSATDVLTGYRNGEVEVVNTGVGGIYDKFGGNLRIGWANNIGNYFLGAIDEVRVYNLAVPAEKVRSHYKNKGLLGYWGFNEGTGTIVNDSSENGNTGTVYGATWGSGGTGCFLNFDGTNDYVNILPSTSLNTQSFSAEMWINPTYKVSDSDGFFYSSPSTLRVALYNVNHKAWVRWRKTDGNYAYYYLTATAVPEGEWSHLAFTYDKGTDVLTGYFNGALGVVNANVGGIYDKFGGNIRMGWASSVGNYFLGSIDEVGIYDRALTADEVGSHFNSSPMSEEPTLALTFVIETRDAKDVSLTVNGQAVTEVSGEWPVILCEGVNVIGMTASSDGANPGLRLSVPDQTALETRWRVGTPTDGSWVTGAFDDRSWTIVQPDGGGYLCFSSGTAYFRQIVVWAENHYSNLPCVQPKVREWGFSEGSMETLFHPLYTPPPLTFPLADYEFVLDVPTGFSFLQQSYNDPMGSGRFNRPPQSVTSEQVQHDSQNYTRYRFSFSSDYVQPYVSGSLTQMALIPIALGESESQTCQFYYRRQASGNLTEIEQELPVRILPPINGQMPENVAIQQYCSVPWLGNCLYPEHFEAHMNQSLDAGFNHWIISPASGDYGDMVYDSVLNGGGKIILWGPSNYPLWGNVFRENCALGQWMLSDSATHARFFNDISTWQQNTGGSGWRFCPSYVTGAGAVQFKQAVKDDIELMFLGVTGTYVGFPDATTYWTDWEQLPWRADYCSGTVYTDQTAPSYCFCTNCKEAFRQYAGLPPEADLSDDNIKATYKAQWSSFREELDGNINSIVRDACNELGLQYMVYDQATHSEFWEACEGKIDVAFPGLPGGDICYSNLQSYLDSRMDFFRNEAGMPRVIGQQFAATYTCNPPWSAWVSRQESYGFWNPKMVKLQILRIIAAVHGGIDLNSSFQCFAGMKYYIGEATRIISEFENLFWDGERMDSLASSAQIQYPNLLVLKDGDERLVLLFNEGITPRTVTLQNIDVLPGQLATIYGIPGSVSPATMEVTIGAQDVAVVHIQ